LSSLQKRQEEKEPAQTDDQTDNAIHANKAAIENLRPLLTIFEVS
jgi:hypothetical protein